MNDEKMGKHTIQCFRHGHTTCVFLIWRVRVYASAITRLYNPGLAIGNMKILHDMINVTSRYII